jgi:hypothetical protein
MKASKKNWNSLSSTPVSLLRTEEKWGLGRRIEDWETGPGLELKKMALRTEQYKVYHCAYGYDLIIM